MVLEKPFWEMIFGSENVLHVYSLLNTYFKMVSNLHEYVKDDDDDKENFGYCYRDNMIAQFTQH